MIEQGEEDDDDGQGDYERRYDEETHAMDRTQVFDRPRTPVVDLRYWLKVAAYTCIGILMVLGVIIAVALTLMVLRYVNSKPS